jgi:hypothetical protein
MFKYDLTWDILLSGRGLSAIDLFDMYYDILTTPDYDYWTNYGAYEEYDRQRLEEARSGLHHD